MKSIHLCQICLPSAKKLNKHRPVQNTRTARNDRESMSDIHRKVSNIHLAGFQCFKPYHTVRKNRSRRYLKWMRGLLVWFNVGLPWESDGIVSPQRPTANETLLVGVEAAISSSDFTLYLFNISHSLVEFYTPHTSVIMSQLPSIHWGILSMEPISCYEDILLTKS